MDWGTSNFRAFRIGESGDLLDKVASANGVLQVEEGAFAEGLRSPIAKWLVDGECRVLLCGMVGSRVGWKETEYLHCPAGVDDLAEAVVRMQMQGVEIAIVPGVRAEDGYGVPEVMRGEETQSIGLLEACGGSGLLCLPGTHSKWVHVQDDRILGFTTHMTGEVFSALRRETILGRTMSTDGTTDLAAFERGVVRSGEGGGLLHQLFGVRSLTLFSQIDEAGTASYLSGLLIGSEVRAAMPVGQDVHVAGADHLCSLYANAIRICGGRPHVQQEGDAAVLGLVEIGRRLSWI